MQVQVGDLAGRRERSDRAFAVAGGVLVALVLLVLGILIGKLVLDGLVRLDWGFLTSYPSRKPEQAGILSAWVGSLLIVLVTACVAVPLGIAAGVYLEEYGRRNWFSTFIEVNITNLAGVPSIIYGLMALGLFVYFLGFGRSILTGGMTLGFLVLPIVVVATREALRSIPQHIREAAFALGATRWQVVWHHLLPYSLGGIATGVILALSRALGETAPLVTIGALTYVAFLPPAPIQLEPEFVVQPTRWLFSPFVVLPIQMFNWVSRPNPAFQANAAAAGVVLMFVTLGVNGLAIMLRTRMRRRIQW